jgi:flavin reductase (DIM6/NTAB) family NADH-FMN oxidoreductase RutF/DNA-binding IclR family transcriptional regulator
MDATAAADEIDERRFRRVLGHFPTGVVAITATEPDGNPVGMAVGSFTSVSINPPLVAFLPDKSSSSFPRIRKTGAFCVNVLGADQEGVCRSFAARGTEKFNGVSWRRGPTGSPVIDGVVAWIDCVIEAIHDAGDHYIVVGRVQDLDTAGKDLPLLFFQGGYGGFTSPWKTAKSSPDLTELLKKVDLARDGMMAIADEMNVECRAQAVVGAEIVNLGGASKPGRRLTRDVGHRLPFQAPVGVTNIAWSPTEEIEKWVLKGLSASPDAEEGKVRSLIERARTRGWSLVPSTSARIAFGDAVARSSAAGQYPTQEVLDAFGQLVASEGSEPEILGADEGYELQQLSAPVFDLDGQVIFSLVLAALPATLTGAEVYRYADLLVERSTDIAARITSAS